MNRSLVCGAATALAFGSLLACSNDRPNVAALQSSVTATPAFVQVAAAVPQSPQTAVSVTLARAQSAGNLLVVLAGWNDDQASVTSVSDARGDVFGLAVGPTRLAGAMSQSIYYARNIAP